MNYFFFAIFILSAAVGLLNLGNLLRVATGNAHFNSGFAAIVNFVTIAASATIAVWAFGQAFPA